MCGLILTKTEFKPKMDLVNSTSISCTIPETIFNLTDPDKAYHFLYGPVDTIIITVIIPIISVVGIVGNAAFIYMSYRVPELRSATVTSYLVHLAVCDILFLLFINGWYAAALTMSPVNSSYPVNSIFGCAMWTITTHWWYLASLGLITLISMERYFAICQPVTHRNARGKKARSTKQIVATWLCSLLLTLTLIPRYSRFVTNCMLWPDSEDFENLPNTVNDCEPMSKSADIYASFMEIITLLLTMIINIALFTRIIQTLRSMSGTTSSDYADRVRYQVTRTLVANGIIFFVCQVPFRVFTIDDVFDNLGGGVDILPSQATESMVLTIGRAFVFLNSIINPYLYVFSCQHYRRGMVKAFCGDRFSKVSESFYRSSQITEKRSSSLTRTSITAV